MAIRAPLRTDYSSEDGAFSIAMHQKAQTKLYPSIYRTSVENLAFTSLVNTPEDFDEGIDQEVEVTVHGFGFKLPFVDLWQERFRRLENCQRFNDITITEWNNTTDLPSELYKIRATLFLYAKYDTNGTRFSHHVAFYVHPTLMRIRDGKIPFKRGTNAKNQTFLSIQVADLVRHKVVQSICWPGIERE